MYSRRLYYYFIRNNYISKVNGSNRLHIDVMTHNSRTSKYGSSIVLKKDTLFNCILFI